MWLYKLVTNEILIADISIRKALQTRMMSDVGQISEAEKNDEYFVREVIVLGGLIGNHFPFLKKNSQY